MKTWRIVGGALLAAIAISPLQAAAQNLLTNGSFETGFTGWTPSALPCRPSTQAAGGTSTGAGAWTAPTPKDGTQVYMGDTGAPGTCTLFQDVVVPAGVNTLIFHYDAGYNYHPFGLSPAGCDANVALTDTANVPIAVGYAQTARATDDPLAARTPIFISVTPGATVRVLITEVSCAGGPVGIVADNFILAAFVPSPGIPTLSDWAKVVLALLVVGVALRQLRKRAVS